MAAGGTALRTSFPYLFLSKLAYLNSVIFTAFKAMPSVMEQLFSVERTNNPKEQFDLVGDLGLFEEMGESENYPLDEYEETYQKTFTIVDYGLSLRFSEDCLDDDQVRVTMERNRLLGKSAFFSREILGASVFNNGFDATNYPIPDGQALCDGSHPLADGATDSNLGAADLDFASLEAARIAFQEQLSHRGNYINAFPKMLLVPLALNTTAFELLKSELRPDTAENAVNALQQMQLNYGTWHHLTDTDAWFLLGDKSDYKIKWFDRMTFRVKVSEDIYNDDMLMKAKMRFDYGAIDWRHVWGSPGA